VQCYVDCFAGHGNFLLTTVPICCSSVALLSCRDIAEEESRLPPNKERDKEDKLLERAFWSRWDILRYTCAALYAVVLMCSYGCAYVCRLALALCGVCCLLPSLLVGQLAVQVSYVMGLLLPAIHRCDWCASCLVQWQFVNNPPLFGADTPHALSGQAPNTLICVIRHLLANCQTAEMSVTHALTCYQ
jgi:hypothetical protein